MTTTTLSPPIYLWAGWYRPGPLHSSQRATDKWRILCTADDYPTCLQRLLHALRTMPQGNSAIMKRGNSPADSVSHDDTNGSRGASGAAHRTSVQRLALLCFSQGQWLTNSQVHAKLSALGLPCPRNSLHVLLCRLCVSGQLQRRGAGGKGKAMQYALAERTQP